MNYNIKQSMNELIFYSDDEDIQFNVSMPVIKLHSSFDRDEDGYITSLMDSKSFFKDSNSNEQQEKQIQQPELKPEKKMLIHETETLALNAQDDDDADDEESSQFVLQGSPKPAKIKGKRKKERVSDQNVCKRYHSLANKCLRSLKLYKFISPYIKKIHKRNYFLYALVIAQKNNLLSEFTLSYEQKVKQQRLHCQKSMKNMFMGSKEYKKNKQMLKAMSQSLKALNQYINGKLEDAVYMLYDVENMKRQEWISEAIAQVLLLSKTIQTN